MKKLFLLLFILTFWIVESAQSQMLVNVVTLQSFTVDRDGKSFGSDEAGGGMLIAYNKSRVKVFENDEMSCQVEMKYKTCGKKVKLTKRTIVELKNGDTFKSGWEKYRAKISEDDPGYFLGKTTDEFDLSNNSKLTVSYDYSFRYKSPDLAYR